MRGLLLTRCHLGWTIYGKIEPVITDAALLKLKEQIKGLYKDKTSVSGNKVLRSLKKTRELKGGDEHFEVGQINRYNNFTLQRTAEILPPAHNG